MMNCRIKKREGISRKTGKEYRMYVLVIETDEFGEIEVVLNTHTDRAGIILSTIYDRKEASK